jgi:hypothetical protein
VLAGPLGRAQLGRQGGGGWYPPHRGATRTKQAVGQIVFPLFLFTEHSVNCFLSNFWANFNKVILFKLFQQKICLENSKVTETFLKSSKLMNLLIHVSAANN